ncbi:MAG: hypothetical protein AAF975_06270 [Spirochaetota bacterium]
MNEEVLQKLLLEIQGLRQDMKHMENSFYTALEHSKDMWKSDLRELEKGKVSRLDQDARALQQELHSLQERWDKERDEQNSRIASAHQRTDALRIQIARWGGGIATAIVIAGTAIPVVLHFSKM